MKRSTAILCTLVLIALFVANSADFLFRQPYIEVWDSAANSLSVIRAKHFEQLYGPYSRWLFHHPGPVLFYVQAFGEWLFYDTLHWAASPFAGQTLAHLPVMCCFFVAALMIFGNWVPAGRPRWWFLCGALVLGVLHFTAMSGMPSYDPLLGPTSFMSMWSAHALVLPFLCLLTAGASVASGRGRDLPILALAGGYLVQLHVAQPMFVGPIFAVAYAALLWQANRERRAQQTRLGPAGPGRRLLQWLGAAWRAHSVPHVATGLILLFFALPMLLDLTKGADSNFAAILHHLRLHHDHKPLSKVWLYFLQFAAYAGCNRRAYSFTRNDFGKYNRAEFLGFVQAHAALYVVWSLVALITLWAFWAGLRAVRGRTLREALPNGAGPSPADACRFRGWAAAILLLAIALTLRWDVMQDGYMFYFNAWFTFSIYYFAALIALAVLCAPLVQLTWGSRGEQAAGLPHRWERLGGIALVAIVAWLWAPALRLVDSSPAATRQLREDIVRLEAASRRRTGNDPPTVKMVWFWYETAPVAINAALQLARDGVPFAVEPEFRCFVGDGHDWNDLPEPMLRSGRVELWHFEHAPPIGPAATGPGLHITTVPYLLHALPRALQDVVDFDDIRVFFEHPPLDPAAAGGASIVFKRQGNALKHVIYGWSGPEAWGAWSSQPHAVLGFRPVPVPDDTGTVEITLIGLNPCLAPARGLKRQRLRLFFEGAQLGADAELTRGTESLVYQLPAAVWNRRAKTADDSSGRLELEFPDCVSPASLDPTGKSQDKRQLGIGIREVRFRYLPPAAPPAVAANPA